MHVLVIGCGSIGQRHIKNLVELGVGVSVVESNTSKWQGNAPGCGVIGWHSSIDNARWENSYDAAVVAVPTHLHMGIACNLAVHNMPLFIEKPVSHKLKEVGRDGTNTLQTLLERYKQWAVVGYSMRFHPAIQIIKDLLPQIGTPLYARAEVGQYLPDWHPEEERKNTYQKLRLRKFST